jgi:hypothetical protein
METHAKPVTAFILSLIGGLIILVGGVIGSIWYLFGGTSYGGIWGCMMGSWHGMMGGFGFPYGYMAGFSLAGLVSGLIVVVGGVMLNVQPAAHTSWGILILVFSIISFIGMGRFFIGAIVGIIGGAFAISWRPR